MAKRASRAPRQSRAARQAYWVKRVEAWRGSGLNQSAFCRREGLGLAVFGGWKRLLERKSGGTRTAQQAGESVAETFVPVKVSAESSKGSAARPSGILELELRNGRVLRFPSSLVPDDLAGWAAALETRPC